MCQTYKKTKKVDFKKIAIATLLPFFIPSIVSADFFGIGSSVPKYDLEDRGSFLEQIEGHHDYPKTAYAPPQKLTASFVRSPLTPEVAYALSLNVNFVDAPDAQRLAQNVVDRLIDVWGGPKPAVKVLITGEAAYGAHANRTGTIFLSIGTFNADGSKGVSSLDELALLLGHELGHILLGHLDHIDDMQHVTDIVGLAATGFIAVSAVKDTQMTASGVNIAGNQRWVDMGLIGGLAANTLLADIIAPSWTRENEMNADKIGVDLARHAGYMVAQEEFTEFVKKHCDEQTERSQRMERLANVVKAMEPPSSSTPNTNILGTLIPGMPAQVDAVINRATDSIFDSLAKARKEHPSAEDRISELETYFSKAYPEPETGPDGRLLRRNVSDVWQVSQSRAFQDLLAKITAANHDLESLTENILPTTVSGSTTGGSNSGGPRPMVELPSALAERAQAIAQSTEPGPTQKNGRQPKASPAKKDQSPGFAFYGTIAAPFTWEVSGELLNMTGRSDSARRVWEAGLQSPLAALDLFRNLGQLYARMPGDPRLSRLIEDFKTRMGSDEEIPDLVVASLVAAGDTADAEVKAAECYAYDEHRFYPSCASYLGYDPTVRGVEPKTEAGKKAFKDKISGKFIDDIFAPLKPIFK